MADQVDNAQNPLIPPPKKDELSNVDPNQFKQAMKELTTDTEQKGEWQSQQSQVPDDDATEEVDQSDDQANAYVSEDNNVLGPTSQASSSAASAPTTGTTVAGAFESSGSTDQEQGSTSQKKEQKAAAMGAPGVGATPEKEGPLVSASGAKAGVEAKGDAEMSLSLTKGSLLPQGEPGVLIGQPSPLTPAEKAGPPLKDEHGMLIGQPMPLTKAEKGSILKAEKTAQEGAPVAGVEGVPLVAPASQDTTTIPSKEREKDKIKEKSASLAAEMGAQLPPQMAFPNAEPLTSIAPTAYTQMSPGVMELFDKMVSTITVMVATRMTETVIKINVPPGTRLARFNGTEISIKEYATAKGQFHIQFKGNPEAVSLAQSNKASLQAAFREGKYGFIVQDIDISHFTEAEKPQMFKRKGAVSGDKEE